MTPEALALETLRLLDDSVYRNQMIDKLASVQARLGQSGAASRVADACVELLEKRVVTT